MNTSPPLQSINKCSHHPKNSFLLTSSIRNIYQYALLQWPRSYELASHDRVRLLPITKAIALRVSSVAAPQGDSDNRPIPPSSCTSTSVVFPTLQKLDHTTTIYESTVTATSSVDCDGCLFVTESTRLLGPGPVSAVLLRDEARFGHHGERKR